MEEALKLVDHYGLPLVALVVIWLVLAPLARKVAAAHIEAVEALVQSSRSMEKAVEGISRLLQHFGQESLAGHRRTHERLDDLEDLVEGRNGRGRLSRRHRATSDPDRLAVRDDTDGD